MKIVIVGLGYVGLSNAVLLAKQNEVIGVDILKDRIESLNARKSHIVDKEISDSLSNPELNIKATSNLEESIKDTDYVIVSTPTNYDEETNYFDTSSVESVIEAVILNQPNTFVVIRSTIPVGFVDAMRERFQTKRIAFCPEFLREGSSLHDNLYPSRIIIGDNSRKAKLFTNLLVDAAEKKDIKVLYTGTREAEAIKLFANSYLAMRVAFINELDSYSMYNEMNNLKLYLVCL